MPLPFRVIFFICFIFLRLQASSQSGLPQVWETVASTKLWSPVQKSKLQLNADTQMKVVVFLSTECPMCISYTKTVEELKNRFSSQVSFYGIFPGRTYSDVQINEFVSSYKLTIPVFVDKKMKLTNALKAEVTPEVFLFDSTGKCIYRGAIDDWLVALGKKKTKPDQHYLLNAIEQTLRNEPVLVTYTKAQGCLLNDY